jgi:hypothetical protein
MATSARRFPAFFHCCQQVKPRLRFPLVRFPSSASRVLGIVDSVWSRQTGNCVARSGENMADQGLMSSSWSSHTSVCVVGYWSSMAKIDQTLLPSASIEKERWVATRLPL